MPGYTTKPLQHVTEKKTKKSSNTNTIYASIVVKSMPEVIVYAVGHPLNPLIIKMLDQFSRA